MKHSNYLKLVMIRELGTKYSVQICALPLQTCKDVCFGKMYSGALKMKR